MKNKSNHIEALVTAYAGAKNRILLLDYDGTLAPFVLNPQDAYPTDEVLKLLFQLTADPANQIIIISGRERGTLEEWLGNLPLTLVAEHGGFYREQGQPWKSFFAITVSWKMKILPFLQTLVLQHNGSSIEEKHFSMAWHYRAVASKIKPDTKDGILLAVQSLLDGTDSFSVYDEDCTLEFRTSGIDKGAFVHQYLKSKTADFVLAIGDGKTDEDLFKALEKKGYSMKVGYHSNSKATFFLKNQAAVAPFLESLVKAGKGIQVNSH